MTTGKDGMPTTTPPNILVIMSDEHAPMFSGPYGHPQVRTRSMDRLAAEGVTFRSAYCNSPLCVPSRMSFLTGQYASRHEVYDNASPLGSGVPTWAHLMRGKGYDVALAGKQHFVGPDQLHGFSCQLSRDLHAEWTLQVADWCAGLRPASEPWHDPFDAGPGSGEHIDVDDQTAEAAVAWLSDPMRRQRPWALCASFLAPHFPLIVPERFWRLYSADEVDLPATPAEPERQHPVYRRMQSMFGLVDYPEDVVRRARAAYYGLISYLDEKIGLLLSALDRSGQADNTLVIYTSDHGEMNGEHGMWRKSNFYEQSVRVPLQMRWPGYLPAGKVAREVVSLVDVAASLLAATGCEPVSELDGEDLLPLARGECPAWKDEAYAESLAHGVLRPTVMVRSGRFKLNVSLGDPDELYDLVADPEEVHDLGEDPRFAATREELQQRVRGVWNLAELEQRVLQSQRERMTILGATGWTPSITPEESRRLAHVDRSLAEPGTSG